MSFGIFFRRVHAISDAPFAGTKLLDVKLGRERVDSVADRLMECCIPVLFTTCYGHNGRPRESFGSTKTGKDVPPETVAPGREL